MADAAEPQDAAPKPKRSRTALLAGVLAALALGAGGFYATYSGLVPASLPGSGGGHGEAAAGDLPDIAFVTIEPMVLSLGGAGTRQHLRFAAEIEVPGAHSAEVTLLRPRILDVMNSYLRAIEVADRGPVRAGAPAGADAAAHPGRHRRRPGPRPSDYRIRAELRTRAMDTDCRYPSGGRRVRGRDLLLCAFDAAEEVHRRWKPAWAGRLPFCRPRSMT